MQFFLIISQELKQLFEVVKQGFIQEAEYERRKRALEHEAAHAFQPAYALVTAPPKMSSASAQQAYVMIIIIIVVIVIIFYYFSFLFLLFLPAVLMR